MSSLQRALCQIQCKSLQFHRPFHLRGRNPSNLRESHSEANPLAVLSRDLPAPGGQLGECGGSCKELCQPQPTKQLQRHLRTKDRAEWKIREDRWGRGGELCRMAVDGISRLHLIQILLPLLRFHCGNTREASSNTSVELRFLPTVGSSRLLTASKYFFKILQKISNIGQKIFTGHSPKQPSCEGW